MSPTLSIRLSHEADTVVTMVSDDVLPVCRPTSLLRRGALRSGPVSRVAAGAPAEERAVTEPDAAGVVVGRQAGRSPADGVQARDATPGAVERGTLGIGDEAAEREGGVNGAVVDAQVDGADAARRRHPD